MEHLILRFLLVGHALTLAPVRDRCRRERPCSLGRSLFFSTLYEGFLTKRKHPGVRLLLVVTANQARFIRSHKEVMRVICTECGKLRANLLVAKERLSVFVKKNGRKRDREVGSELRALVVAHIKALNEWEAHVEVHEKTRDDMPAALRARLAA